MVYNINSDREKKLGPAGRQSRAETGEKGKKMIIAKIINQHGEVLSRHHSEESAERKMQRNLAWRCGICGSTRGGWGQCSHGSHNRVCSARHYNDRIVFEG